jgi:hypothetical protein
MGTDQASVRSDQISLPTYPQRPRAQVRRESPLQTARGISIIAMQLSSAAHAAVLDFHADNSFIKYISGQK